MTDSNKMIQPIKKPAGKTIITIATVAFFLIAIVLGVVGWRSGIFTSMDAMNAFLESMGIWAPLVFILIQIIQIIIPVIPGAITCSVGVLVFGPLQGFIYNYFSIVVGSFLAFCLARRYGVPLIRMLTSDATYEKYAAWLDKGQAKFDKLFAAAIFLPFSPDDLLCMLAGVSKMPAKKCLLILVLCKPAFLIPYSLGIQSLAKLLGLLA